MTIAGIVPCLAVLMVIAALWFPQSKVMLILAMVANALLLWVAFQWSSLGLVALGVALIVLTVWRFRKAPTSRKPTRSMSEMDHEVHENIRKISAESRYSSAGIEF